MHNIWGSVFLSLPLGDVVPSEKSDSVRHGVSSSQRKSPFKDNDVRDEVIQNPTVGSLVRFCAASL